VFEQHTYPDAVDAVARTQRPLRYLVQVRHQVLAKANSKCFPWPVILQVILPLSWMIALSLDVALRTVVVPFPGRVLVV
jgi:hypothetical protein